MSKVFCVIPAYNEEKNIGKVVSEVKRRVDTVLVVDDGSSDNTANEALKQGATVIRHIINRGQGAALMTGNVYALKKGAGIIVHFDADGQFRAEDIDRFTALVQSGEYEAVFGSRFLEKRSRLPLFKKVVIMPLAQIVNRVLFGISFSDPQSGFRAMNARVAKELIISNDGAAHCTEIMYKIARITGKIKEISIFVDYNNFGQGVFKGRGRKSGGFKVLKDLLLHKIID